jgi:hypothetical protein
MGGLGLPCTANTGASQCADTIRMALGVRPIWRGMSASAAASWS